MRLKNRTGGWEKRFVCLTGVGSEISGSCFSGLGHGSDDIEIDILETERIVKDMPVVCSALAFYIEIKS